MEFTKDVERREMEFALMMSALDIGTEIISVTPLPKWKYRIKMVKYPLDLQAYIESGGSLDDRFGKKTLEERITDLIDEIHDLGLIHGDLHFNNIVLNPNTGKVRLIDFAYMQYIDEVDLKFFSEFWGIEEGFENINQVLEHEYKMHDL